MTKHLIALTYLEKIGPITLKKILQHLTPEEIWQASFLDFKKICLNEKLASLIIEQRKNIYPAQILEELSKKQIKFITYLDPDYPSLLKEIYNHPLVIYYQGNISNLSKTLIISVVGTRKLTSYGKAVLEDLIPPLINQSFVIVSGLALGTDAYAHQLTTDHNGQTIAVLGSGPDQIYPRTNQRLAQKILENNGTIISEFPLGMLPLKQNFPVRNRIISGLSPATLITEADQKSGALITAKYALEQNREVLTIPGNISQNQSRGTNKLIQSGAKVITEVSDILEVYNLTNSNDTFNNNTTPELIFNSREEEIIFKLIKDGFNTLDQLKIQSELPISILNSNLTMLEIKGIIKNTNGEFII